MPRQQQVLQQQHHQGATGTGSLRFGDRRRDPSARQHRDGRPRQARGDQARPRRARCAAATCCSRTCPARRRRCSPARSPAAIEGATTSRIQCTPDLQPTDVTGLSVFNQQTRDFEFRPGPIFANVVLVDEINRATPKTQSALLEAMAERQVTVDGVTRELPDPFLLLATENPIEYEGTFPLPEAQLDRFFLRTALGYPGADEELTILEEQRYGHPLGDLAAGRRPRGDARAACRRAGRLRRRRARSAGSSISSARRASSTTSSIGASVRGSLALERAARAWALLHGRDYVMPDDVERLFVPVLAHRLVFTPALPRRARAPRLARLRSRTSGDACLELAPRPEPDDDAARSSRPLDRAVADGARREQTFPLVPRRRLLGLPFGTMRSVRRGRGSDVAGSRPVPPGDDIRHDRLGRLGAALRGTRPRRVRRPRAVRREGAARRRRLRPQAGDGVLRAVAAVARQGGAMRRAVELVARRALRSRAASAATSTSRTASRSGCRRGGSGGSRELREERLDLGRFGAPADRIERSLEHLVRASARRAGRAASSSSSPTFSSHRRERPG